MNIYEHYIKRKNSCITNIRSGHVRYFTVWVRAEFWQVWACWRTAAGDWRRPRRRLQQELALSLVWWSWWWSWSPATRSLGWVDTQASFADIYYLIIYYYTRWISTSPAVSYFSVKPVNWPLGTSYLIWLEISRSGPTLSLLILLKIEIIFAYLHLQAEWKLERNNYRHKRNKWF